MRRECSLLPHIKEPVYGLNTQSVQFLPWALKKFNVERAWSKSSGKGVVVAVVDTGCDINHDDLKDNVLPGYNFVDRNKNVEDRNGHGTHVAGTVAAINNDYGMVGVAPEAKILPVKALGDDGSGTHIAIANGIMWAVDNGAHIITMSLGSPTASRQLQKAIDYAVKNDVVIFCAAGNSGNHIDIMYPAKFFDTISIGAISRKLSVSNFSCCGDTLDFVAPGEDIVSCAPDNGYAVMSGTSMATPYAVGCAALLLSANISMTNNRSEYVSRFSKNSIHITGKHSGDTNYEGNGIIRPIY